MEATAGSSGDDAQSPDHGVAVQLMPQKLLDNLVEAVQHPGVHVLVEEDFSTDPLVKDKYPIEIVVHHCEDLSGITPWNMLRRVLRGRRILVLGSGMGNGIIRVPPRVARHCLIIFLRTKDHYGCRAIPFEWGVRATWEGETALEPVQRFWQLLNKVAILPVEKQMCFMGCSAGVDHILSMVASKRQYAEDGAMNIYLVVCIAGNYHHDIFPKAVDVMKVERTRVIVQHHVKDKLCDWFEVYRKCWSLHENDTSFALHVNAMTFPWSPLMNTSFHNAAPYLFAQPAFWTMVNEPPLMHRFVTVCKNEHIVFW